MTNKQTERATDEGTDKPNLFLQREREREREIGVRFEGLFCFVTMLHFINIHLHTQYGITRMFQ